jgi:hypothetical protein
MTNVPQRIYYGVYFKKDTFHKSDWEYAVIKWVPGPNNDWMRDSVSLEVDGNRGRGRYGDIPNTFDNSGDQYQDGNHNRDTKFYLSKHHNAVHWDMSGGFKSTCPPAGKIYTNDFRANDFQFGAWSNLRHIDFTGADWTWVKATNPHETVRALCDRF